MKTKLPFATIPPVLRSVAIALPVLMTTLANAQTLWTGPNTNFQQLVSGPYDVIVAGAVALDRGTRNALYNEVTESGPNTTTSPEDTLWAFGTATTISQATNLSYQTFANIRNNAIPDLQAAITNRPMVLQLINEQIYIPIEFTAWPRSSGGGFTYTRATPPAAPTPSVSITNPASGAVFAAPASIPISANATVSSGTVTNVTFFGNATSLGSATNAPFTITTGSLPAGPYALKAVATAAGVSSTSIVVNISVVTPVAVTESAPQATNGTFVFSYTANPGLTYIVQGSSNFTAWLSLVTNVPSSSPVLFTDVLSPGGQRFYRVARQTNP